MFSHNLTPTKDKSKDGSLEVDEESVSFEEEEEEEECEVAVPLCGTDAANDEPKRGNKKQSPARTNLHCAKSYRPFELFVNENYKL